MATQGPWGHGRHWVGEKLGPPGGRALQAPSGTSPSGPSAACQAETNRGRGTNSVKIVTKRKKRRSGKSVR